MGVFERVEQLKQQYTDKFVVVDDSRPELRRFQGQSGTIKTINMNGRALVEFDADNNIGWFDIALDYLRLIDAPLPKPEPVETKKAAPRPVASTKEPETATAANASNAAAVRSPAAKPAAAGAEKTAAKKSTADILAAARAAKAGAAPAEASASAAPAAPAAKPAGPKPSTADILAAARGKAAAAKTAAAPPEAKAKIPVDSPTAQTTPPPAGKRAESQAAEPRGKMSTADILAAARGKAASAAAPAVPSAPLTPSKPAAPAEPVEEVTEPAIGAPMPAEPPVEEEVTPVTTSKIAPAEPPAAKTGGEPKGGPLPTTTAERIAYCRRVDAH